MLTNKRSEKAWPNDIAVNPPTLPELELPYDWKRQLRYSSDTVGDVVAYSHTTQTFDAKGQPKDRDKD